MQIGSTAANDSGVFEMNNGTRVWVANTWYENNTTATAQATSYNTALTKADSRYVDKYVGATKHSLPGDGIGETDGWGGATTWNNGMDCSVFFRSVNGMFGYFVFENSWNGTAGNYPDGRALSTTSARAVVVCGKDF